MLTLCWWQWALFLLGSMLFIIMLFSVALSKIGVHVVFTQKDRKSIRRLVLPDSAVHTFLSSPREEGPQEGPQENAFLDLKSSHHGPLIGKMKAKVKALPGKMKAKMKSLPGKMTNLMKPRQVDWNSFGICREHLEPTKRTNASSCTPVLVFVNSRAGGKQGTHVLKQLRMLLHHLQVVALPEVSPEAAIHWWSKHVKKYRVIVCGGDGTAGWVLGVLDKMQDCLEYIPPVAILPLGTGNDLARVLGWGGGYTGGSILPILQQMSNAHTLVLDRWAVTCRDGDGHDPRRPRYLPPAMRKDFVLCNYFGIGVDAAVALDFHNLREQRPELFFSRMLNKVWYAWSGLKATFIKPGKRLRSKITIECDGIPLEIPPNLEGIVVLNIGSFGGGTDLWGFSEETNLENDDDSEDTDDDADVQDDLTQARPRMNDGKLEVVGVQGALQLGAAQVGLSSFVRLAQASRIKILNSKALPIQVDGEPSHFAENGEIEISLRGQSFVSARSVARGDAMATEIVDFAWERKMISADQRRQLLNQIADSAVQGDVVSPSQTAIQRLLSTYLSTFLACTPLHTVAQWFSKQHRS